ncbi:hypothetical protein ACWEVD_29655, partial [Nocardia thailandica]
GAGYPPINMTGAGRGRTPPPRLSRAPGAGAGGPPAGPGAAPAPDAMRTGRRVAAGRRAVPHLRSTARPVPPLARPGGAGPNALLMAA